LIYWLILVAEAGRELMAKPTPVGSH
jgi:hypothetical protein